MTGLFRRPGPRLALAAGVQCLLLLSVIGFKQYTIVTGTTVVLQTTPVDPRSLFRGDYVRLAYDISTLDPAIASDGYIPFGTVFVELAPGDGGIWRAVNVYPNRRPVPDGHVLIRGDAIPIPGGDRPLPGTREESRVTYGIEEVFVPEGSGRAIERTNPERVTVEVSVDRFGNAIARRVLIDGQPYDLKSR
jgi:uncharacterized membrane-anchored protein